MEWGLWNEEFKALLTDNELQLSGGWSGLKRILIIPPRLTADHIVGINVDIRRKKTKVGFSSFPIAVNILQAMLYLMA